MAVQPNIVVGAIGLVIALVAGAYIAQNWTTLTELEEYRASFSSGTVNLREKSATMGDRSEVLERHLFVHGNVTQVRVDLHWQDPTAPLSSPPRVTFTVKDPADRVQASRTQQGGATGIQFDLTIIKDADVPKGSHLYSARGDDEPREIFEERWPAHPETRGNWTFLIHTEPGGTGPSANIVYSLKASYDYYEGSFSKVPEVQR